MVSQVGRNSRLMSGKTTLLLFSAPSLDATGLVRKDGYARETWISIWRKSMGKQTLETIFSECGGEMFSIQFFDRCFIIVSRLIFWVASLMKSLAGGENTMDLLPFLIDLHSFV